MKGGDTIEEAMNEQTMAQFEEQVLAKVLVEHEAKQVFAQT